MIAGLKNLKEIVVKWQEIQLLQLILPKLRIKLAAMMMMMMRVGMGEDQTAKDN